MSTSSIDPFSPINAGALVPTPLATNYCPVWSASHLYQQTDSYSLITFSTTELQNSSKHPAWDLVNTDKKNMWSFLAVWYVKHWSTLQTQHKLCGMISMLLFICVLYIFCNRRGSGTNRCQIITKQNISIALTRIFGFVTLIKSVRDCWFGHTLSNSVYLTHLPLLNILYFMDFRLQFYEQLTIKAS